MEVVSARVDHGKENSEQGDRHREDKPPRETVTKEALTETTRRGRERERVA